MVIGHIFLTYPQIFSPIWGVSHSWIISFPFFFCQGGSILKSCQIGLIFGTWSVIYTSIHCIEYEVHRFPVGRENECANFKSSPSSIQDQFQNQLNFEYVFCPDILKSCAKFQNDPLRYSEVAISGSSAFRNTVIIFQGLSSSDRPLFLVIQIP